MIDAQTINYIAYGLLSAGITGTAGYIAGEIVNNRRLDRILDEYSVARDAAVNTPERLEKIVDEYVEKLNSLNFRYFSIAKRRRDSAIYHMTYHRRPLLAFRTEMIFPDGKITVI